MSAPVDDRDTLAGFDDIVEVELPTEEEHQDEPSSTRSLVRLLAVAASVLLISFLVVNRSSDALTGPAGSDARFRSGNVSLVDDDTDQSLFDVPAMAPGQEHENCIGVTYAGVIDDPEVRLAAEGTGALAGALIVSVEAGQGGGFGDCAEFLPESVLYEGRLDAFVPLTAFAPTGPGDQRTFRFTFVLADDGNTAQGAEAAVDFDWTVRSAD